ncbi:MAG: Thiol-disulfide oxidoreductase ResA [Bacteroidetes bacterium ADurb.Bin408]|nr:MAG: Thiol-disulfide oxidoreductase ResA [Bacteroidetes bacterium ADurb.Bin408]
MNRIISLTLITFLITGLNLFSQNPSEIVLRGKLAGANAGSKLYLYEIDIKGFLLLDSVVLDRKGQFVFKASDNQSMFLVIRTEENKIIKLIAAPGEHISINGNYIDISDRYDVKGSPDSEIIRQIDKEVAMYAAKLHKLMMLQHAANNADSNDSLIIKVNKLQKELKSFLENLILEHIHSLASLVAINQVLLDKPLFSFENDFLLYRNLSDSLIKTYPQNKHARAFYDNVQGYVRFKDQMEATDSRTAIGTKAPEIILLDKDSNKIYLSSLNDKVVLIRFWNPACDICRDENKTLKLLYNNYKNKDFEIFNLSIGTKREEWLFAINEDSIGVWVNVKIPEEGDNIPNMGSYYVWLYGVKSIPFMLLINKEGIVTHKGFKPEALDDLLSKILF